MEETANTAADNTGNTNNTAAAAESLVDSVRRLMEAVGNDEELKGKLEDVLAAMTGETSGSGDDTENDAPAEAEKAAPEEEEEEEEKDGEEEDEEENDDDDAVVSSAPTDLSDIFTEDALAGMVVGFIAGAAVVGGGVLLHKVLSDN